MSTRALVFHMIFPWDKIFDLYFENLNIADIF